MITANTQSFLLVEINGTNETLPAKICLSELLILKNICPNSVAIVVNDAVVPKSRWSHVLCQSHDRISLFSAVAGG